MGALKCTLLDENDQVQTTPQGTPIQIRVGGGFTDVERWDVALHFADNWEFKVIEVKHNGITDTGKVLGPNFVRLRGDRTAPLPPIKKPPRSAPRTPKPGSWMRNYGAMSEAKLRGCLADFARGSGDAVDRVNAKNGDLILNEQRCIEAARAKGIQVRRVTPATVHWPRP